MRDTYSLTKEISVPKALLEAIRDHRVVFFVGAGASKSAPSNLPLYAELVERLADLADYEVTDFSNLDRIMGALEGLRPEFELKKHAVGILEEYNPVPNDWHRSIVSLANASGNLRIVTTNYDLLLERAAQELGLDLKTVELEAVTSTQVAFNGIVHLHGSLLDLKKIVISDTDFGNAYLDSKDVPNFLSYIFKKFVVLFVGYSLSDPIMHYFLRARSRTLEAFILLHEDEVKNMQDSHPRIGVINFGKSYNAASEALGVLNKWEEQPASEATEEVVRGLKDLEWITQNASYLRYLLAFEDKIDILLDALNRMPDSEVRHFINWLKSVPEFHALFQESPIRAETKKLAQFFIERIAFNKEYINLTHDILIENSMVLSDYLVEGITEKLVEHSENFERKNFWNVVTTFGNVRQINVGVMTETVEESIDEKSDWKAIFQRVLKPMIKLINNQGNPDAEVKWNIDSPKLRNIIEQAKRRMSLCNESILEEFEKSLRDAYEITRLYMKENYIDILSFKRKSIAQRADQTYFISVLDQIIDTIRDVGRGLQDRHRTLIQRWWSQEYLLFKRLAINLLQESECFVSEEKFQWLVENVVLDDWELRFEIFDLLATLAPTLSEDQVVSLIDHVEQIDCRKYEDVDLCTYMKYTVLEWVSRKGCRCVKLGERVSEYKNRLPHKEARKNPQFVYSVTVGFVECDDVIARVNSELTRQPSLSPSCIDSLFKMGDSYCVGKGIRAYFKENPLNGIGLLSELAVIRERSENNRELEKEILRGWSEASDVSSDVLLRILCAISAIPITQENIDDVAQFLNHATTIVVAREEFELMSALIDAIGNCLEDFPAGFLDEPHHCEKNVLQCSINSWNGLLAMALVNIIESNAIVCDENRQDYLRVLWLIRRLYDLDGASHHALTIFCHHLQTLYERFRVFALCTLKLCFSDKELRRYAWAGFLHHAFFSEAMAENILIQSLNSHWDFLIEVESESLQDTFFLFLILYTNHSKRKEVYDQLLKFAVTRVPSVLRKTLAEHLVNGIVLDDKGADEMWEKWVREYLSRRLKGLPRLASDEEIGFFSDFCLLLDEHFAEAQEMLRSRSCALSRDVDYLYLIEKGTKRKQIIDALGRRLKFTDRSLIDTDFSCKLEHIEGLFNQI